MASSHRRIAPNASAGLQPGRPTTGVVGSAGWGLRSLRGARAFSLRDPSSAPKTSCASPTRLADPVSFLRSTTISILSPSCNLPMAPPASASGEICPYAGTGGDAAEAGVGEQRHLLAGRQHLRRT